MRRFAKDSTRWMVLVTVLTAQATRAVDAQQARPATAPQKITLCVADSCTVDTTRFVKLRLIRQIDSLQRVFFDRGLSQDNQRSLESQISAVIARLAAIDYGAAKMQIDMGPEGGPPVAGPLVIGRTLGGRNLKAQQMAELERHLEAAMPRGWIGISPIGPGIQTVDSTGLRVRYLIYPTIESVDPDSPAERAGVARGDVLVAFNGADVTASDLAMSKLLQPDHKLTLRVRRSGADRDFAMIVGQAPETFLKRQSDFMRMPAPLADADNGGGGTFYLRAVPRDSVLIHFTAPEGAAGRVQAPAGAFTGTSVAVVPDRPIIFSSFDADMAPVAGARMTAVDEDLGRNFGVASGVLVLRPAPGSLAAQAGLKGGDVIVKAGGKTISSVRDLRRLMEAADSDRYLELQVIRDKKPRTIILKW